MSKRQRTPKEIAEGFGWQAVMGYGRYVEFSPLIAVVGNLLDGFVRRGLDPHAPELRATLIETVREIQSNDMLQHNTFIPCRFCDQAFEPVVDDALFELILAWYEQRSTEYVLAIHRCTACGGTLAAKQTKTYAGDWHTPTPGTVENDEVWVERLFQNVW